MINIRGIFQRNISQNLRQEASQMKAWLIFLLVVNGLFVAVCCVLGTYVNFFQTFTFLSCFLKILFSVLKILLWSNLYIIFFRVSKFPVFL